MNTSRRLAAMATTLAMALTPAWAEDATANADDAGTIEQTARDAGRNVEDATITARIETMYLLNEYLNPFRINTTTHDGIVVLEGTVDDTIEKDLAETLAMNIDGVKRVENQLAIDPKDSPRVNDERRATRGRIADANLTADVRRRLAYNNALEGSNIAVEVRDQAVRLYGTVPNEDVEKEAIDVAQETRGVLEVRNDLVVDESTATRDTEVAENDQHGEAQDLKEDVKEALSDAGDAISDEWVEKRVETQVALNRNVSMLDLDIEVENGVAVLSGTVISDQQKELAGSIARRTSGVQDVENNIHVQEIRTQ